jgi:hypothetical protein
MEGAQCQTDERLREVISGARQLSGTSITSSTTNERCQAHIAAASARQGPGDGWQ